MAEYLSLIKQALKNVLYFTEYGSGLRLRTYQEQAAMAIIDSVLNHRGLSFVVIFPRQSGKNELQAQIEAYLLTLFSAQPAEMVKVSPTWKPQSLNAMRRLERVLKRNVLTRDRWLKQSGYIFGIGDARIFFLSGGPNANVVGATANVLLECDEAQDVLIAKWDKDFAPMAASTNATRVFWGTMWTSKTLLARELRAAREAQARDGIRRVFLLGADQVAAEVPAYGRYVQEQVARLGRNHPMVKSQYYSEEVDSESGMFPDRRLALMRGDHARQTMPTNGKIYAMLVDVAGEDEALEAVGELANPKRDATAITIVEVDLSTMQAPGVRAPTYRVVNRYAWVGIKHSALYDQIHALVSAWGIRYLVIDGTGVGAGMASFLARAYPERVITFTFNQATKSKLGWGFLSVIETGRFKDWAGGGQLSSFSYQLSAVGGEQEEFWRQCRACQMEIVSGPEQRMRWGVPDGTRDAETGELVHDDWIMSAALCAVLDEQEWATRGAPLVVRRADPLEEMDQERF